jgi:signal transduction histidine kinase
MVEHLLRNAQDATPASGTVRVDVTVLRDVELDATGTSGLFPALTADALPQLPVSVPGGTGAGQAPSRCDIASLTVTDSGCGMNADFIKARLFRPFDSTKGSKGMGIGAYQVREYVHSIGGRVRVTSIPGEGTQFVLRLPLQR